MSFISISAYFTEGIDFGSGSTVSFRSPAMANASALFVACALALATSAMVMTNVVTTRSRAPRMTPDARLRTRSGAKCVDCVGLAYC